MLGVMMQVHNKGVHHTTHLKTLREKLFLRNKDDNNRRRGTIFKTSQHRNSNHEGKILLHLAYKLRTDYKCLSLRHGILQTMGP